MNKTTLLRLIPGWILHLAVGGIMILAGSGKVFGFAPPEVIEGMKKHGLEHQLTLIGAGELVTALLLLFPRTCSLGVLLASGFWGGAICIHMAHQESYLLPAVFLVLVWVGGWLRYPEMFSSFRGSASGSSGATTA